MIAPLLTIFFALCSVMPKCVDTDRMKVEKVAFEEQEADSMHTMLKDNGQTVFPDDLDADFEVDLF